MVSPSPRKAGGFWCVVAPLAHSRTRPLQREKSKDFRNHVTKYLETLLNSQQQVSRPSPLMGFTPRISAAPAVKVLPSPPNVFCLTPGFAVLAKRPPDSLLSSLQLVKYWEAFLPEAKAIS